MKLSVVTTLYKSSPYVLEFYERMTKEAKKITDDYEIIFVNDGSPDDSLEIVLTLHERDKGHVKVVDLSRNFGHHSAIMCGLELAFGDFTFLIDSDLDESPELLGEFWCLLDEGGCDYIAGEQKVRRKQSLIDGKLHLLFYWFFNVLGKEKVSSTEMVVRLMNRAYVDALVNYKEYGLFLPVIWGDLGFTKKSVLSEKMQSPSSYTMRKKLLLSVDALVSSSATIVFILFFVGCGIFLASMVGTLAIMLRWLLYDVALGWTSLIVSVWLGVGMIMMTLGIIGIYIAKVFNEVKRRPRVSVRRVYD